MRILLLPLTRRQTLLFAQRLTENERNKPNPWLTWVMQRTQKTWSDWGKSDTKWKAKTVATGNRLLDKIDWEEYSLKTVHDPKTTTTEKVPVVHPSWVEGGEANDIIGEIVRRRRPIHQQYRWRWALVIPLTLPFSLIPVLPNFPFFYAVYRIWSHHKALKGGDYLEQLIRENALVSEPSEILDKIFALKSPPTLTLSDIPLGSPKEELLISKDQFASIAEEFEDNEIRVLGKRAISQITKHLDAEVQKQEEEKRQQLEADNATKSESEKGVQNGKDIKAKEEKDGRDGQ